MTLSRIATSGAGAVSTATFNTLPASIVAGDILVLQFTTNASTVPTTMSGWTYVGSGTSGAWKGGVFFKKAVGGESGSVSLSGLTGGTKGISVIDQWRSSDLAKTVDVASAFGYDTNSSSTAFSVSAPSWSLLSGDVIGVLSTIGGVAAFTASSSGLSLTQAGATITPTQRYNARAGSPSNTLSYTGIDAQVTAAGSGAPTFNATTVGANGTGVGVFYRMRETVSNTAPTVDAGTAQTVEGWDTVSLSATASDPDGTIASYSWSQVSGPTVTLTGTGSTRTFKAPLALTDDTVTIQVTVTDDLGATASDTVDISILAASERVKVAGAWKAARMYTKVGGVWV